MARKKRPAEGNGGYEVGYGRPPRHTRFQKGRSGNPNGRPRESRRFPDIAAKYLNELVTVRKGGRELRLPMIDAVLQRVLSDACSGDKQAIKLTLGLAQLMSDQAASSDDTRKLTEEDQAILQRYVSRFTAGDDDAS